MKDKDQILKPVKIKKLKQEVNKLEVEGKKLRNQVKIESLLQETNSILIYQL